MWIKDPASDSHSASISPLARPPTDKAPRPQCLHLSYGPLFLLLDEIREIKEDNSESPEGLTSQQVFLWLQGLFLFALVWTVASTINTGGRREFDLFFRNLIMGLDDNNPRPKSVKLTKNNIFPERGNLLPGFFFLFCLTVVVWILCSKPSQNVWTK